MFKWIRLIRFIKKKRKEGHLSFKIVTNKHALVIYVEAEKEQEHLVINF